MRRYSDGLDLRKHDTLKLRKPRSWQPSPYGSDEDDDQLSREEKKAKIKAEIARRRQQIEENARLHEELLRLARLRESAELGFTSGGHSGGGYAMSSVLKSIDDLLLSGHRGDQLTLDSQNRLTRRTAEDRSMDRIASTFQTDDYTCGVYERLTDFSPLTDYATPHAMPLLPDMPTRSRKLLEDLGSSPITESVLTIPQKGKIYFYLCALNKPQSKYQSKKVLLFLLFFLNIKTQKKSFSVNSVFIINTSKSETECHSELGY